MGCSFKIPEEMTSTVMWLMTLVIGIGLILLFLEKWKKIKIDDDIPPIMILIGFIGSIVVGLSTNKKREGFKSLYGF